MSRFKCGCVHADAKNTPAVRLGYEVGGYLKTACAIHSTPHEISGKTPDELWLETGRLGAKLANQDAVIVALTEQMQESNAELSEAEKRIRRLSQALREIQGISQGSTTANSLQHLAQIASDALGY